MSYGKTLTMFLFLFILCMLLAVWQGLWWSCLVGGLLVFSSNFGNQGQIGSVKVSQLAMITWQAHKEQKMLKKLWGIVRMCSY